jgi:hypothetical protein
VTSRIAGAIALLFTAHKRGLPSAPFV